MAILAVLAATAVPYAEMTVRREREQELRQSLREIRTALDRFHDDWTAGRISRSGVAGSEHGWPRRLEVLVEGVELAGVAGGRGKYLRRVPRNPFGDPGVPPVQQWGLRSYEDEPDSDLWGAQDVFDVYAPEAGPAIDGTRYREW